MTDETRYGAAATVAAEVIEGEAVIINLDTGVYHSMDRAGAQVWEALAGGATPGEVVDALSGATGVARETAAADVARVLEALLGEALLVVNPSAAAPASPLVFPECEYGPPTLTSYRDMRDLLALDPPAPGLDGITWTAPATETKK